MESPSQPFQLSPMKRHQSQQVAREIAAMSRHLIERDLGWSWRPQRILRNIQRPDTIALIAHQERRMLGFGIMRYRELQAHLLLLGVKPDVQRQGVGRALMMWLEGCARADGATQIVLEVLYRNATGRAFYRSLGYKLLHHMPYYYRGRASGLQLVKNLEPTLPPGAPRAKEFLPQLQAQLQQHASQLKASFADTLTEDDRWLWEARIDTDVPISVFALQQQAQERTKAGQEPPELASLKQREEDLRARWTRHCQPEPSLD